MLSEWWYVYHNADAWLIYVYDIWYFIETWYVWDLILILVVELISYDIWWMKYDIWCMWDMICVWLYWRWWCCGTRVSNRGIRLNHILMAHDSSHRECNDNPHHVLHIPLPLMWQMLVIYVTHHMSTCQPHLTFETSRHTSCPSA